MRDFRKLLTKIPCASNELRHTQNFAKTRMHEKRRKNNS